MSDNHFDKIRQYLSHLRTAKYEILIDEENLLQFTISNKYCEKLFTVHYCDSFTKSDLNLQRPMYHYYYLQFEQDLYPYKDDLCVLEEWKWYTDEDDVLYRIKQLRSRYNR